MNFKDWKSRLIAKKENSSRQSESTSWHRLSADQRLSKIQRITWILYNLVNNAFPLLDVDRRISRRKFLLTESKLDAYWNDIPETASPSRRLCDFFWMNFPWSNFSSELHGARIMEMGCGTGSYGQFLERRLGPDFEHYLGVDIAASENWDSVADSSRFRFEIGRASEAYKYLPGTNLILTQSAIEHFEEDLTFFKQITDYVADAQHPILQIHLFPSARCIRTFLWHGVRVYTPRTISKISRLFGKDTKIHLLTLGSSRCNGVHWRFITWPYYRYGNDLRETRINEYREALRSAILADFDSDQSKPAFYALVLASNFSRDIFETQH